MKHLFENLRVRQLGNEKWELGYNDYFDGKSRNENPYQEDTEEAELWEQGWDAADADDDT